MKKSHIRLGVIVLVSAILGATLSVSSQSPTCPAGQPVCHTITPMGGHGTASGLPAGFNCNCPSDGRRVINIFIDPSWGTTTNARIWNAVQCAVNKWNNATDGANPPNKTGYYLQVDQNRQIANPPDITIKNQTPSTSPFASSTLTPSGWEMRLAPINATLSAGSHPDEDVCGRVAHELGHILGLNGISTDCFSVMHASNTDGTRSWNTVTANDVFQVNRNLDNTTRTNGYCKPPQNLSDTPGEEGGGDPGGGDPCNGDPCCGDPCCGDPCCGDPCCGDPCCGDPNCGQECYEVCVTYCYSACTVYDDYGECYWTEEICETSCETQCY